MTETNCGGPWHELRYGAFYCPDCGADNYPDKTVRRRADVPLEVANPTTTGGGSR